MLKPQLHLSNSTEVPFLLHKPFIHGNFNASLPISMHSFCRKNKRIVRAGFTTNNIKAVASSEEKSICLKAIVTVKPSVYGLFLNLLERKPDDVQDFRDKALILQLVELDPGKYWSKKISIYGNILTIIERKFEGRVCGFSSPF